MQINLIISTIDQCISINSTLDQTTVQESENEASPPFRLTFNDNSPRGSWGEVKVK